MQQRVQPETIYEPPPNCVTLTRYFYTPEERPDDRLWRQFQIAESVVRRAIPRPLLAHQREALLCLVSDVASGLAMCPNVSFESSFLVTALNRGMFQIAAAEFHVFCYSSDGKVQARLWGKRKAEMYLFSSGHLLFE